MKWIAIASTLLMLFTAGSTFGEPHSESPPNKVIRAAQQGLKEFSPMLKDLLEESNDIDTDDCTLGYAFRIYTINPQDLIRQSNPNLHAITQPTNIWRFSVLSEGTSVALLTVEKTGRGWKAVSIGASGLAKEMDLIRKDLKQRDSNLRFVRVYQATSDFVEVSSSKRSEKQYAALNSARISLDLDEMSIQEYSRGGDVNSGLISNSTAVTALKSAVLRALSEEPAE